ncbi:transcription factor bHLH68-like isoform X2 [Mangifera indica]|uniref:transcription factor bHLH68-like isoform X2 n=1 Tax=Mangifera indica TaxID=29780 RepID=UPI001CFA7A4E|nr:transcription factor bHLH68-like isoform X2 [Mangifera indica]
MNRGVLQSSPVQQMMAGNPNLWNINSMRPPSSPQTSPFLPHPNFFPPPSSSSSWDDNQGLPESWSQLLFGRMVEEDERGHLHGKKMESWEEQVLHHSSTSSAVNVKRENHQNSFIYGLANEEFQAAPLKPTWSQMMPVSSPKSCVTSFSSNMLDFSTNKADGRHPPPDPFSECNSTATGGAAKKARNQPAAATQSKLKVRKEKLGDRVTALHQLVSPFGKTDTASVLLETIGYIRFLQSQIEALSLPYLGVRQQQHPVQGERNCIFPEDPGQELVEEGKKDLRSRGLCLVPLSCTLQVGSDSGADYWAPSSLGGGFR